MCNSLYLIDDDMIQHTIFNIQNKKYHIADKSCSFSEAGSALDDLIRNQDNFSVLPDVILLDINMPEMNGWQFLDKFESLAPMMCKDIDIFIVSSSVDEMDKKHSRDYPSVKGFFTKPLSHTELLSAISNLHQD